MSNWIEEEGKNVIAQITTEQDKQALIKTSNFWADLLRQLEADVDAINNNDGWKTVLTGIKFQRTGTGAKITQTSFPAAFEIQVDYEGDFIEVKSRLIKNSQEKQRGEFEDNEDRYVIVVQGNTIYLKKGFSSYLVPVEASKAILSLLIKAKNYAQEFFAEQEKRRTF
jgi:hypothetical protein